MDAADYVVIRNGLGSIYSQVDELLWRANFGNTASVAGAASLAAVPEPSMSMLARIATLFIYLGRSSAAFRTGGVFDRATFSGGRKQGEGGVWKREGKEYIRTLT